MYRRRRATYDRAITVFSPEGRLLQVEYALEVVKRGATVLGIACTEGVVLAADVGDLSRLHDLTFPRKLFQIEQHVGVVVSGLSADARVLIDRAREYAQQYRLMYDNPADINVLSERISRLQQLCIQRSGIRPFGVSLIFGGVDKRGASVFLTDPSGTYRKYTAVAIGTFGESVTKIIEEEYRDPNTLIETIRFAIQSLSKTIEPRIKGDRLRVAIIPTKTKILKSLTPDEVGNYLNNI